mmetsp:Transcript_21583/g.67374  ORF Transcript_21583/g.67374 Transcript_21583/m.67374 type:complete len:203 (+) Transcript_21583:817-1425(+)
MRSFGARMLRLTRCSPGSCGSCWAGRRPRAARPGTLSGCSRASRAPRQAACSGPRRTPWCSPAQPRPPPGRPSRCPWHGWRTPCCARRQSQVPRAGGLRLPCWRVALPRLWPPVVAPATAPTCSPCGLRHPPTSQRPWSALARERCGLSGCLTATGRRSTWPGLRAPRGSSRPTARSWPSGPRTWAPCSWAASRAWRTASSR